MKKVLSLLLISFQTFTVLAQSPTTDQLQETAKSFMRQGDYANAILVLNRAVQQSPNNVSLAKDLAMSYYYQKDNVKALEIIKPVLDNEAADDQCYQIAGNIYKQLQQVKDCEKLFKKGIKRFPESGPLYNELGELQWAQKDYEAIKNWEKGIELDPSYSRNYYNAALFYYFTNDKVWSILYAETFLNMEPLSNKSPEVKQILVDSYKKLFSSTSGIVDNKEKNPFIKAYLETMEKQTGLLNNGVNTESLTMIRTRFILDWFNNQASKQPYKLFDYQQQLLKEGMFEAYNQWLFGVVQDLTAYQNWVNTHTAENAAFNSFQKGRIYKVPKGQYYR